MKETEQRARAVTRVAISPGFGERALMFENCTDASAFIAGLDLQLGDNEILRVIVVCVSFDDGVIVSAECVTAESAMQFLKNREYGKL